MENETTNAAPETQQNTANSAPTKFCKNCGGKIAEKAVFCPLCGCQVEEMHSAVQAQPQQIVINNTNANSNVNQNVNQNMAGMMAGRMKNKWVSLLLCLFLGFCGAHKFYEGKIGMGVLYLFTWGLFGIGAIIDCIVLLFKPNPYFV